MINLEVVVEKISFSSRYASYFLLINTCDCDIELYDSIIFRTKDRIFGLSRAF